MPSKISRDASFMAQRPNEAVEKPLLQEGGFRPESLRQARSSVILWLGRRLKQLLRARDIRSSPPSGCG